MPQCHLPRRLAAGAARRRPGNVPGGLAQRRALLAAEVPARRCGEQLTDRRAKPAVPFAGKLKVIDFALSNCVNSGIHRIAVLIPYKAQSLIRHAERGWGFRADDLGEHVDVSPALQRLGETRYSGTADAVLQNLNLLHEAAADYVLVLAGITSARWTTR